MVSQRVQQPLLAAQINAIGQHASPGAELKTVNPGAALQVHLFPFSFYKGIKAGSPGVCVCFMLMKGDMH